MFDSDGVRKLTCICVFYRRTRNNFILLSINIEDFARMDLDKVRSSGDNSSLEMTSVGFRVANRHTATVSIGKDLFVAVGWRVVHVDTAVVVASGLGRPYRCGTLKTITPIFDFLSCEACVCVGIKLYRPPSASRDRPPRPRTAPRSHRGVGNMTTPRGTHPSPMKITYQPGRRVSIGDPGPGRPQTAMERGTQGGILPYLNKVPPTHVP